MNGDIGTVLEECVCLYFIIRNHKHFQKMKITLILQGNQIEIYDIAEWLLEK